MTGMTTARENEVLATGNAESLDGQRCVACTGGIPILGTIQLEEGLRELNQLLETRQVAAGKDHNAALKPFKCPFGSWEIVSDNCSPEESKKIRLRIRFRGKDAFVQAVYLINKIKDIAELECHHPDLHLTNFNLLTIEIFTHKVQGLTQNDLILGAKITNVLFICEDTKGCE